MISYKEVRDCKHPALMSAAKIGRLELKNRIVMLAMGTEYIELDGSIGERALNYYEARAAGGAGLIILETSSVAWPFGMSMPRMLGLSSDDCIFGLEELAKRVHRHGCRIAAQLNHSGKVSAYDVAEGREILVPSIPKSTASDMGDGLTLAEMANFVRAAGPDGKGPRFKEMDRSTIDWMVSSFADAAELVVRAGFDAIEIHAGHGYILSSFLSPYANRRQDCYGGSLENRARLLLEIVDAIQKKIGTEFPIIVRIDAHEYRTEGGINVTDSVAVAAMLEKAGCHAIDVSAYSNNSAIGFTEGPLVHKPGGYIDYAKAIKSAVSLPVIAVGRIEPDVAERHICDGDFDLLGMGRKLLADPELPNKLRDGRIYEIRPCIYCYVCVSQIFINKPLLCAVNPATGSEGLLDTVAQVNSTKRILVVGGGPAGMEAARVLAERGHDVEIWERDDQLGGTLRVASLAYHPNGQLIRYLKEGLRSAGVKVVLSKNATIEQILVGRFDHIVLAIGADRRAQDIPGKELSHVLDGEELRDILFKGDAHGKLGGFRRLLLKIMNVLRLNRNIDHMRNLSRLYMPLGKRITIIGGGLVGLEVAELLAERGREVTVIEAGRDFGAELSIVRRWRVLHNLRNHRVKLINNAVLNVINENNISFTVNNIMERVATDNVVIAMGAKVNTGFFEELKSLGVPVDNIGDGQEIGYIEGAIRSARELAVRL